MDESLAKFHVPDDHKAVLRVVSAYSTMELLMAERMTKMKEVLSKDGPDGD